MTKRFGEVLRRTRKGAGVNLQDLAESLGFTASYLSLVEKGRRGPFDKEKIFSIAERLGVPADDLLEAANLGEHGNRDDMDMLDVNSLALARLKGMPKHAVKRAADGLFRHPPGFRADAPKSYTDIEQEAERLRILVYEYLGEEHDHLEPFRLTEFLDMLEVHAAPSDDGDQPYKIAWRREELPEYVDAFTRFVPEERAFHLLISPMTDRRLRKGEGRSRFAVAHEAGHFWLHQSELRRLAIDEVVDTDEDVPPYKAVEWQANAFAGALLAPALGISRIIEEELKLDLDSDDVIDRNETQIVDKIFKVFGISYPAAERRWAAVRGRLQSLMRAAKKAE
ncbi:MAG: ImmA/IrrE family metallo-endopeptidase [Planctomycetes bacterium]|nr:ImmA/IrrE family metallo-endopeptidase [Planctomycetota bacterium]